MKNKSFTSKRFGFTFKVFINNETTVVSIVNDGYCNCSEYAKVKFQGIAKVNIPDKYDYKTGLSIAMKSAINKYTSYMSSQMSSESRGMKNKLRQINDVLSKELVVYRGN